MRKVAALFAATLLASAVGGSALAATYDFGTIGDSTTFTSNTINHPSSGNYDDYFTFNTGTSLTEFTTGAFTEADPFGISKAALTLYSGVIGSGIELVSTGSFNPMTQATPTISYMLDPGNYYVLANVTVPQDRIGSYTVTATTLVSAAPEPGVWALMLGGIGLLGGMLRVAQARRREKVAVA